MVTVRDGATWWAQQMGEALGLSRWRGAGRETLVLLDLRRGPDGTLSGLDLVLRRRGREIALGSVDLDEVGLAAAARLLREGRGEQATKAALLLRLPPGELLERPLSLPIAVERDLDRVLAYEMDRISPFSAGDLFWTHEVVGRDLAQSRLDLRVWLAPKAGLLPLIGALREAGLPPAGLTARRADGTLLRIGLEPPGTTQLTGARRTVTAAAAACAVLAVTAAVLPFARQESAMAGVEARIERLRPATAEAEALRRRIAAGRAGADVFAAEAARGGRPLQALATLTAILPDDTHLTAFSLRQRALAISGRSAAAARLIPALSDDPAIHDAAFAAPVTRGEGGRGDLFSIRAQFGP